MIESLICDLAYILLMAAVVSVIFKRIKQPVVLGYIVAGFLASPNFAYLPSPAHADNIDFWAELGIVILLFSLGLEFSFKKLINAGGAAIITALIIIIGMMATGFCIGHALGFSTINCIFLGGMVSMSSTTIILKALSDLGMRHRKFTPQVFAVLIVEDLFAVLMMVILSSIALNNSVEGSELLFSAAKLVFFLVAWFLVGTYILPTLLNLARRYLSDETLLIVAMGLCLGMAWLSVECGFSLALGAFVMGSILAGTSLAERIEHVVEPVKNLFGAVFFISVGMMVNPGIIAEYWSPILILSAAVIVGMIIFGTVGMVVTGQPLKLALQSGFTLTQIGEFSFIIASLGMSLGVLDPCIYPIVVAVSVITTFTTPYFIRMADPAYNLLERILPKRLLDYLEKYATGTATAKDETTQLWKALAGRYAWRVLLYSVVLIAISILYRQYVMPQVRGLIEGRWGEFLACTLWGLLLSPFLIGLTYPASKASERKLLREANARNNVPLVIMSLFRLLIAMGFVMYVIANSYGVAMGATVGAAIFILIITLMSKRLNKRLVQIESRFLDNLNERELRRTGANNNLVSNIHLAYVTVGHDCSFVGERLASSNLRQKYGVNVASVQRGGVVIPVPGGNVRIYPGDVVGLVGTEEQLQNITAEMEREPAPTVTASNEDVKFTHIRLTETSLLVGKTISEANVRANHHALIVAIKRDEDFIPVNGNIPLKAGDNIWLVAQPSVASSLC